MFLSDNDIGKLAAFFSISQDEFKKKYTRMVDLGVAKRRTLLEQENFDCIFWSEGGCSVYPVRPLQCKSYPFWNSHLHSQEAWDQVEKECPGVNIGKHHPGDTIKRWIDLRKAEPFTEE